MPWKEETIMSLKEDFIRRALAKEEPFSQLCSEYKITRKTGYSLINRYIEEGPSGLVARSKRPINSPGKTDAKIEELIITTRLQQPTWGPRKIFSYLTNKGSDSLPAISTISAILKRHNMISITESLKRQKFIRFERENPNDLFFIGHKSM
jgi:hypothetical protein